jgi:cholesterol oxidase
MKRLIAAPPSQGIRVRNASPRGEGPTSVHVIDDGSRGYPSYGLLVAVERRGERYVPSSSGSAVSPHPLGGSVFCVEIHDHAPPYPINVPQGRWPSGGSATLVLLVYFEVIDAGQATLAADASDARARAHAESVHLRGAPLPADEIGPASPMWLAVIGAVDKLLGRTRADDLDFGRIEGAPAERSEPRSKERGVAPAVSFALMSCQYPCDILDHMPAGTVETPGPADASLLKLGKLLDGTPGAPSPTLLLMAGDQVYIDATAGLFDPKSQDDRYRNPYYTFFASRGPQAVLNRPGVDVRMMLDDHEISDNWEPGDEPLPREADSPLRSGLVAFHRFQRDDAAGPRAEAFESFEHRGLHFFLADTRTERQARKACDFFDKLIMGEKQLLQLKSWLVAPERSSAPKFVLTSSILLPRRLATARDEACGLHSDAWDGYPRSLQALLEWVCDHQVQNLVFLSGDEHLGCEASITVRRIDGVASVNLRSVHCPALYAPYPFANSVEEDFAAIDRFGWCAASGASYHCEVSAGFPVARRHGFAVLTASPGVGAAAVDVAFWTV